MATYTITDDLLLSPEAEAYFSNGDRRIKCGLRATLELLRIPLPPYAKRLPAGSNSQGAKRVIAAHALDNPTLRSTVLAPRKPNASPADICAAVERQQAKQPGTMFEDTFG